jgi:mRNA interferase MazF
MSDPKRGEIWLTRFDPSVGAEIQKLRPAAVISLDVIGRLPLRIVVPITDWKPRYTGFVWMVRLSAIVKNGLLKDSVADCFQVKSVSTDRLVRRLGTLAPEELEAMTAGIAMCIGYS